MRSSAEWKKKSMKRSERNDDDAGGNNMKKTTTSIVGGRGKTDEGSNGMSVAAEGGLGNLCRVE